MLRSGVAKCFDHPFLLLHLRMWFRTRTLGQRRYTPLWTVVAFPGAFYMLLSTLQVHSQPCAYIQMRVVSCHVLLSNPSPTTRNSINDRTVMQFKTAGLTPPLNHSVPYGVLGSAV